MRFCGSKKKVNILEKVGTIWWVLVKGMEEAQNMSITGESGRYLQGGVYIGQATRFLQHSMEWLLSPMLNEGPLVIDDRISEMQLKSSSIWMDVCMSACDPSYRVICLYFCTQLCFFTSISKTPQPWKMGNETLMMMMICHSYSCTLISFSTPGSGATHPLKNGKWGSGDCDEKIDFY